MASSWGCPRSCLREKAAVVKAGDSLSIGSLLESSDTIRGIIGIEMVRISSYDVCTLDVVNYCNSHRILVYKRQYVGMTSRMVSRIWVRSS